MLLDLFVNSLSKLSPILAWNVDKILAIKFGVVLGFLVHRLQRVGRGIVRFIDVPTIMKEYRNVNVFGAGEMVV